MVTTSFLSTKFENDPSIKSMERVTVGAASSHWCYKPVPHWPTIKSRFSKGTFYKGYLRILILNLGVPIFDLIAPMFVRGCKGSKEARLEPLIL